MNLPEIDFEFIKEQNNQKEVLAAYAKKLAAAAGEMNQDNPLHRSCRKTDGCKYFAEYLSRRLLSKVFEWNGNGKSPDGNHEGLSHGKHKNKGI